MITSPHDSERGPAASLIGASIGTYRIVREVGRGGMGTVYEAVHKTIGQRAAVKVLSAMLSNRQKFVNRFFVEARSISMVRHPGLVNIFDYNQLPDGTIYILMEFLEGDSLWQRYERLRRIGSWLVLANALKIARQIASTLAAVHRKGIVHRDLKPENVILIDDPDTTLGERAKLLDFGIAKLREPEPSTPRGLGGARRTTAGIVLGTPVYMSPEQYSGDELDGQSDVYSLGVMIYEMVARHPPFEGEKWADLAAQHLRDDPPSLRKQDAEVPGEVEDLIQEMLAKDPNLRPPMMQVVDRLDELIDLLSPMGPRSADDRTARVDLLTIDALVGDGAHDGSCTDRNPVVPAPASLETVSASVGLDAPVSPLRYPGMSRSARWPHLVAIVGLLLAGSAAAIWLVRPTGKRGDPTLGRPAGQAARVSTRNAVSLDATSPPPVVVEPLFPGPPPGKVPCHVTSDPIGAQVLSADGQRVLGQTPWQDEMESGATQELVLRHPGYAEERLSLSPGPDCDRQVALAALPPVHFHRSRSHRADPAHSAEAHPNAPDPSPIESPTEPKHDTDKKIDVPIIRF